MPLATTPMPKNTVTLNNVNPDALKALESITAAQAQYTGKSRKYPANNLRRETFLTLNVLKDKYESNTLPEDERLVFEFIKLLRKKRGSVRNNGRTAVADFAFKALAKAIKELSTQTNK